MLFDEVDELLVVDFTDSDNDEVISVVVVSVEILDVVKGNVLQVISLTSDGLAHHVVSESIEMSVLHQSALVLSVVVLMELRNFFLDNLQILRVESGVADLVSEHSDGLWHVSLEGLEAVGSELSLVCCVAPGANALKRGVDF